MSGWKRLIGTRVSLSWQILYFTVVSLVIGAGADYLVFMLSEEDRQLLLRGQDNRVAELQTTYLRIDTQLAAMAQSRRLSSAVDRADVLNQLNALLPSADWQLVSLVNAVGRPMEQASVRSKPSPPANIQRMLRERLQPLAVPYGDSVWVLPVQFLDAPGYVLLKNRRPLDGKDLAKQYNQTLLLPFGIGVLVFCVVLIALLHRKARYIQQLAQQVSQLTDHTLQQGVLVQGHDELAVLAISINAMGQRLAEQLARERQYELNRQELITNLSHDLKSPLTSIIGYLDLLKTTAIVSPPAAQYLAIADRKAQLLNDRINRLFEYSQLINPNTVALLRVEPLNVVALLRQLLGDYVPLLNQLGITLQQEDWPEQLILAVDAHFWVRAFENLVHNVLRYAKPNSELLVQFSEEPEGWSILLENESTQPLPTAAADWLFTGLYKSDPSRQSEGTGLGLAITRRILELHGASLSAQVVGQRLRLLVLLQTQ